MSRRPTNTAAGVSLFPFLAVLVCTMGSLILLLLVTTKRIRAAAIEKARQAVVPEETPVSEPPPIVIAAESEPDEDPTPAWQTQVEQLTAERDALRGQLSQSKSKLEATQTAMMRTKVKVASAADRIKDIREQQEQTAAERERLQAEIDSLQSDLTDAELRLSKAAERQKTAKSKFAFLPFDGRTGTTKRPVLIECTQDYIRFLPEDVRLSPADLNGFTSGFNPLLIASRELIHYWKAYERVHAADNVPAKDLDAFETDLAALNDKEREPYVLLLVRPNGAVAFHIAKGFLSQLKVPHGYELITDDMEIDSSNPDPEAKQICQTAVAQVMAEREKVLMTLTRNREGQRDQLQLEPTARTFVPKEISEPTNAFERPKSVPRSSGSGPERPHGSERPGGPLPNSLLANGTDSPSSGVIRGAPLTGGLTHNGTRGVSGTALAAGNSRENVDPESPVASAKPLKLGASGVTPSGRQGSGLTGQSQAGEEPPEEPLPKSRQYENDDTKPFPLAHAERPKSLPAKATDTPSTSGKSKTPAGAAQRPSNDPRAANNSSNGNNFAKMKRRYLMPRAGIGLEKSIPIRISSNRVLIGEEFEIPVDPSVRTESLIDRVLMAMDRLQAGWPSAGEGYHWVPTIKYEVLPGGEQVHQRLNSGLFDLGLVSSVEYLEADPDGAKPSRETSRSRATPGGAR